MRGSPPPLPWQAASRPRHTWTRRPCVSPPHSPPTIAASPAPSPPRPFHPAHSFPGLYESIHHRVRGAWEHELWNDYIHYKARVSPLPWNEAAIGNVDDAKRAEMLGEIAAKAGLSAKQVGLPEKQ